VRTPDPVEKFLTRDHLSGIAREKLEDPILLRSAGHHAPLRSNDPDASINLNAVEDLNRLRLFRTDLRRTALIRAMSSRTPKGFTT